MSDYNHPETWMDEYAAHADAAATFNVGDHVTFQRTRLTPHGYYTGPMRGQVTAVRYDRATGQWMVYTDAADVWVPEDLVSESPAPLQWRRGQTPEYVW